MVREAKNYWVTLIAVFENYFETFSCSEDSILMATSEIYLGHWSKLKCQVYFVYNSDVWNLVLLLVTKLKVSWVLLLEISLKIIFLAVLCYDLTSAEMWEWGAFLGIGLYRATHQRVQLFKCTFHFRTRRDHHEILICHSYHQIHRWEFHWKSEATR